jgi:hypothetical protein
MKITFANTLAEMAEEDNRLWLPPLDAQVLLADRRGTVFHQGLFY